MTRSFVALIARDPIADGRSLRVQSRSQKKAIKMHSAEKHFATFCKKITTHRALYLLAQRRTQCYTFLTVQITMRRHLIKP